MENEKIRFFQKAPRKSILITIENCFWRLPNKMWTKIEVYSIIYLNLTLADIWEWNCKKKKLGNKGHPSAHRHCYGWPCGPKCRFSRYAISRHQKPSAPGHYLSRFIIPRQSVLVDLVHPNTSSINIHYLVTRNYEVLYAEPVDLDLVHPETTPTNIPYLDTENYGALYIEPVTDDLVHLETTSFILPYLDNRSPSTW